MTDGLKRMKIEGGKGTREWTGGIIMQTDLKRQVIQFHCVLFFFFFFFFYFRLAKRMRMNVGE